MAWDSSLSNSATFAEVVAGKKTSAANRKAVKDREEAAAKQAAKEAKEAFETLGNMFLTKLPRVIKDMIYKELLLFPL
ncbi:hypothetical protein ONS95_004671 [Cadophora gregata]|uniref:uncharacterized protein n=1 Tax=Cadophora gregata TaxID=51156 RepID=UPI0026DD6509|nr:uncharacterized protein ONS95_004671 [Cadophora gregata]KAK0099460.1 hypothetical protein ONS96_008297 [Cadophora gregata f. sp. sojae]KAK0104377.1 hypothetical protein ONS95_004671 [Cadophora gregata]